ncbi:MAG: hypothetical protein JWN08_1127 [Frankiales bacterium]|nr:hypothetical protein [Frankiales bacterium]
MRASSPHHSDVFSHLPVSLMRELETDQVVALVDRLVADGWRPGQLRHRVGAAASQGSVERDAVHLVELLTCLMQGPCPDARHAEERRAREQQREHEAADAPEPASSEVRERHLARMRAELGILPSRRPEPQSHTRPACSLCDGEGTWFVTRDVHLCDRCVAVLATGEARLSQTG